MNASWGTAGLVRRVLMVVSLLVLAGCGSAAGGSEPISGPSTAEPSPTEPPPVYTFDELQAALPEVADVPTGVKETSRCPGDDSCEDAASIGIELIPPLSSEDASAADAEGIENASDISDRAYVRVQVHDDAAAALAYVDERRADAQKFEGDFDVAPEEVENGFVPGEIGSGTIEPASVAGWDGFEDTRTSTWTAPTSFTVFESDGEVEDSTLTLTRGASSLMVSITVRTDFREAGSARAIARQVAEEYVARLG